MNSGISCTNNPHRSRSAREQEKPGLIVCTSGFARYLFADEMESACGHVERVSLASSLLIATVLLLGARFPSSCLLPAVIQEPLDDN